MSKNTFYGTDEMASLSYLEFGSIDLGGEKKDVWDLRLHQRAYDWFMLARYTNDMAAYMRMLEALDTDPDQLLSIYRSDVHHRHDLAVQLRVLTGMMAVGEAMGRGCESFIELGQTLFGCIEGLNFCQRLLADLGVECPDVDLDGLAWRGIDISELFNMMAAKMHSGLDVKASSNPTDMSGEHDVFFAKGVTLLYAVRDPEGLLAHLDRGRCCVFDYSFSLDGNQDSKIGTGKSVRFLGLDEFLAAAKGRRLMVRKGTADYNEETGRVYVDCLAGTPDICEAYMGRYAAVVERLAALSADRPELRELFNLDGCQRPGEWVALEDLRDFLGK